MPSSISTKAPKSVRLRTVPGDPVADVVLLGELLPRVRLGRAERERETPRLRVHVGDDRLDRVAHVEELRRVLDLLRPRHLADVDQTLDALLELDERAVVGQGDDLPADAGADRVVRREVLPRVGLELLHAERDPARLGVELQDLDVDRPGRPGRPRTGWPTRPHDMSVTWRRPSMPPRSTKAPYSVRFLTTPWRTRPSASASAASLLLRRRRPRRGSPCARGRCCRASCRGRRRGTPARAP